MRMNSFNSKKFISRHIYQSASSRSILWPVCEACTVGLFEYLSTLMLICAQSERVSELVKKTDPSSISRRDKSGAQRQQQPTVGYR